MTCYLNPDQFREFDGLPSGEKHRRLPLPPSEYFFKSVEYLRANWLPLAGLVLGIGCQIIPVAF